MIDDKRLAEIQRHLKDAEFGYGVMDNRVYFKDVKSLLDERKELVEGKGAASLVASKIAEVDAAKGKLLEEAVEQAKLGRAAIARLEAENSELRRELENHRQLAKEVIAEEQS